MDSIWGAGRFRHFFYFWWFNYLASWPLLSHLLRDNHKFLHHLHKENPAESERMVFQKIVLGNLARINLRSFDGSECLVKAGDWKIHRALFSLADILERIDLWSDWRPASVSIPMDCHLANLWCWKETSGEENSIWSSGLAFYSYIDYCLSFRLLRFPVKEDNPA